jgi:hypothetical protein
MFVEERVGERRLLFPREIHRECACRPGEGFMKKLN